MYIIITLYSLYFGGSQITLRGAIGLRESNPGDQWTYPNSIKIK